MSMPEGVCQKDRFPRTLLALYVKHLQKHRATPCYPGTRMLVLFMGRPGTLYAYKNKKNTFAE